MDEPASSTPPRFWWLRHDWVSYRTPVAEGKVILADEYLDKDYVIDPVQHRYSFFAKKSDKQKTGDFSAFNGGALFINQQAFKAFEDLLIPNGRIFPVRCDNAQYYIIVIESVHDDIDMKLSEFDRVFDDDGPIEDDIARVRKIVLGRNFSTCDDIFRVDRGYALSLQMIVSDKFKLRYEQSGLQGLFFKDATFKEEC